MKKFLSSAAGVTVGILLAIFLGLMLMAYACSSAIQQTKQAINHRGPSSDAPLVKIGQDFDVAGLHVTGLNATLDNQLKLEAEDPIGGKPNGAWLIIRMHVTNNGNRAHSLSGIFRRCTR